MKSVVRWMNEEANWKGVLIEQGGILMALIIYQSHHNNSSTAQIQGKQSQRNISQLVIGRLMLQLATRSATSSAFTEDHIVAEAGVTGMSRPWSCKFRQKYLALFTPTPGRPLPPGVELATSGFPCATTTNYAKEKLAIQWRGWLITYLRSEFHIGYTGIMDHLLTCLSSLPREAG